MTDRHSMTAIKAMQQATGITISTLRASMTEQIKSRSQVRLRKTKAGLRLSTYTTKLANWPITDAPDDIVG